MKITFDPAKREATLVERGLDFTDAAAVFAGHELTAEDTRRNYGEPRFQTVGFNRRAHGDGGMDAAGARRGTSCR